MKQWHPTVSALRQVVLTQFSPETIRKPDVYDTLRSTTVMRLAQHQRDAEQVRLYDIKTYRLVPGDYRFWLEFLRALPEEKASPQFIFQVVNTALQNASGDAECATATSSLYDAIDHDNPDLHRQLVAIFEPYRNSEKYPLTYNEIRGRKCRYALRTGPGVRLRKVASDGV